mmetsp:Transcript_897/g.2734  ORF Transcript_897/g.2734 Transcript_897/m.2734 type:complete len:205 (-) Transcript_897:548-1162(-)
MQESAAEAQKVHTHTWDEVPRRMTPAHAVGDGSRRCATSARQTTTKAIRVPMLMRSMRVSPSRKKARSAAATPVKTVPKTGTWLLLPTDMKGGGRRPSFAIWKNILGCPNKEHSIVPLSDEMLPIATADAAHGIPADANASDMGACRSRAAAGVRPVTTREAAAYSTVTTTREPTTPSGRSRRGLRISSARVQTESKPIYEKNT